MFTSATFFFWITFFASPPQPTLPAGHADGGSASARKPRVVRLADAPKAADVIKNVQAFYANIKQVTAKFRQQVTNVTFGDTKTSDGMVWIQKPGKMRWDYYSKPKKNKVTTKKSFISNGSYLYVVEHDNKQVIKKSLEKDLMPVAVSFLYGKGDLATDFDGEIDAKSKYGGKDEIVLALTPKKSSAQYKMLYLVVDPSNYRVKQSIIVDSADNVNHFRFYEPDFDKAVEASWFEFDPNDKKVASYRMVNADAQGSGADGSGATTGSGAAPGSATKTK